MIAACTHVVGRLIQYPVMIFFLLYLARHQFLDNWTWPLSLVIWYLLAIAYALGCAIALRWSANRARKRAMDRLQHYLVAERGSQTPDSQRQKRIEAAIREVESLQEGAFAGMQENPIVSAILIPSSGVTLLALVETLLKTQ